MTDFTKRDVAIIAAGVIIATVLTVVATWAFVGIISRSDPRDPLTKVGGLKARAGHPEEIAGWARRVESESDASHAR